jgi:hypothetical protein
MNNSQATRDFLDWYASLSSDAKRGVILVLKEMSDTEGNENKSEVLMALLRKMMNNLRDDLTAATLLEDVDI